MEQLGVELARRGMAMRMACLWSSFWPSRMPQSKMARGQSLIHIMWH
jgi:hypothetical protein